MQDYKKLVVWSKSYDLVIQLYKVTDSFPAREQFGMTSQLRRAAYSVPANLSEGSSRNGKDRRRFYTISLGSINEVEFFTTLAKDLNYISIESYHLLIPNIIEIRKMLTSLIKSIHINK